MKRDIRRVERKKYGQEKARKKFTWYTSPYLMTCLGSSDDRHLRLNKHEELVLFHSSEPFNWFMHSLVRFLFTLQAQSGNWWAFQNHIVLAAS